MSFYKESEAERAERVGLEQAVEQRYRDLIGHVAAYDEKLAVILDELVELRLANQRRQLMCGPADDEQKRHVVDTVHAYGRRTET